MSVLHDQVQEAQTQLDNMAAGVAFVRTGVKQLDDTVPVADGDLVIIGARPAVGKTTTGLAVTNALLQQGRRVLFVTTEVRAARLLHRLAGVRAGISPFDLYGNPNHPALPSFKAALASLADAPLVIVDQAGIQSDDPRSPGGLNSIGGVLDAMVALGEPPDAAVVDYLGRLGDCDRGDQRYQAVGRAVRNLKNVALRTALPIFLLAQLNRECEKREDKRPILADLAESGEIEREADSVLLLWRHDAYFQPGSAGYNPDLSGQLEMTVAKNRFGPAGVVIRVPFDAKTGRVGKQRPGAAPAQLKAVT